MEPITSTSDTGLAPSSRYQLLEKLGEGGMAEVFRAEMRAMGGFARIVALKLVRSHLSMHPDFNRWFMREAQVGGILAHPNLVETLDYGVLHDRPFIAMEYVDGYSLETLLDRQARLDTVIPLDVALQIMIQICRGLDYAHQATDHDGVPLELVHRDLKPSNILIGRHGTAKIADFGVARAGSRLASTPSASVIRGTLQYMSPEQAWGRTLDHRSDLFSLGLILFELLTLAPFYEEESAPTVLRRAQDAELGGRLELIACQSYQEVLLPILTRALAREPQDRYQSAGAMGDALEAILDHLPEHTRLRAWLEESVPSLVVGVPVPEERQEATVQYAPLTGISGLISAQQGRSGSREALRAPTTPAPPIAELFPAARPSPAPVREVGSAAASGSPTASAVRAAAAPGSPTSSAVRAAAAPGSPSSSAVRAAAAPGSYWSSAARPAGSGSPSSSAARSAGSGSPSISEVWPLATTHSESADGLESAISFPAHFPRPWGLHPTLRAARKLTLMALGVALVGVSAWKIRTLFPSLESAEGAVQPQLSIYYPKIQSPPDAAPPTILTGTAPRPRAGAVERWGGPGQRAEARELSLSSSSFSDLRERTSASNAPAEAGVPGRTVRSSGPSMAPSAGSRPPSPATPPSAATAVSRPAAPAASSSAAPAYRPNFPATRAALPVARADTPRGNLPPSEYGALALNSYPQAAIQVDGTPLDRFPVLRYPLAAGVHTLTFKVGPDRELVQRVIVRPGAMVRCTAWFERSRVLCRED